MRRSILVTSLLFLGAYAIGSATTILVPAEYATIQGALDVSSVDDTVLVDAGLYQEHLVFPGHDVVVRAVSGTAFTTLEATTANVPAVTIGGSASRETKLIGFAIRGTTDAPGILIDEGSPAIESCEISACFNDDHGGGIQAIAGGALVSGNVFHGNQSTAGGGGIAFTGATLEDRRATGNILYDNVAPSGAGIEVNGNYLARIDHNQLWDNTSGGDWGAAIFFQGSNHRIHNNTVVSNTHGIMSFNDQFSYIENNLVVDNDSVGYEFDEAWWQFNVNHNNPLGYPYGLDEDPLFVDPANHDYSVHLNSPCINYGSPADLYLDPDSTRNDVGAVPYNLTHPVAVGQYLGLEDNLHVIAQYPTIYWRYFDTAGTTPTGYEIEVGLDYQDGIDDLWASGQVFGADTMATYGGPALEDGLWHFYRIRLFDGAAWGDWTYTRFRTNSPPLVPVPDHPVDDSVNVNYVRFWAQPTSDPEHDRIYYDFRILDNPTDLVPLAIQLGDDNARNRSDVFPGLKVNRAYWWQVRARDELEASAWSAPVIFYTKPAGVIRVPSETPTLTDAIAGAVSGDTIILADGAYSGDGFRDLTLGEQTITIMSENGPAVTTIDLGGSPAEPHRAVQLHYYDLNHSDQYYATFVGMTFENGYADQGGVILGNSSIGKFENCVFRGNEAQSGGVVYGPGSQVTFEGCQFESNAATNGGVSFYTSVEFVGCQFTGNQSDNDIFASTTSATKTFRGCVLTGNIVPVAVGNALIVGGAEIEYSVIHDNQATVTYAFGALEISHSTIAYNDQGVRLAGECTANIHESVIAFNTDFGIRGYIEEFPFPPEWSSRLTLWHSALFDNTYDIISFRSEYLDTSSVIFGDPLFCDAGSGNFRLQAGSPCEFAAPDGDFVGAFGVGCAPTDIGDDKPVPFRFALEPNYPNPFNAITTIRYSLESVSDVELEVLNILGQRVALLVREQQPAGVYEVVWNGRNVSGATVASGAYFYRLRTASFERTRKLLLVK